MLYIVTVPELLDSMISCFGTGGGRHGVHTKQMQEACSQARIEANPQAGCHSLRTMEDGQM